MFFSMRVRRAWRVQSVACASSRRSLVPPHGRCNNYAVQTRAHTDVLLLLCCAWLLTSTSHCACLRWPVPRSGEPCIPHRMQGDKERLLETKANPMGELLGQVGIVSGARTAASCSSSACGTVPACEATSSARSSDGPAW